MYNLQYLSVAGFVRANLMCVFQAAGTVVSSEIVQGPALGSLECSILNSLGDCENPSGSISNPVIFKFDAVRSTTAHHGAAPAKDACVTEDPSTIFDAGCAPSVGDEE